MTASKLWRRCRTLDFEVQCFSHLGHLAVRGLDGLLTDVGSRQCEGLFHVIPHGRKVRVELGLKRRYVAGVAFYSFLPDVNLHLNLDV